MSAILGALGFLPKLLGFLSMIFASNQAEDAEVEEIIEEAENELDEALANGDLSGIVDSFDTVNRVL